MQLWGLLLFAALVSSGTAQQCLPDLERIDCHPEPGSTQARCVARGCTWCPAEVDGLNVPYCFLPRNYGYVVDDGSTLANGTSKFQLHADSNVRLRRATDLSLYGGDYPYLNFEVFFESDYRLRIKITPDEDRFEVPLKINPPSGGNSNPLYDVVITREPMFSFQVIRKSTGTVVFDSSLGGFTFAEQFLQLGVKLPNKNLYGIGENEQRSFRHSFGPPYYSNYPLYARDQPPAGNGNMYGVHPRYTVLEDDGSAHGVLFLNSNAQEFTIMPSPGILYRTIGGIFDIYFFFGPTPEQVVQQYTEAIGRAPLPPYWTLGFHLSRYGYNSIEAMKAAVDRTAAAGIPQDVQHGDIDIMERQLDFTYSRDRFAGLPQYVKEMKSKGVKFITILDPCISIGEPAGTYRAYDLGNQMDVWIKKSDGTPAIGKVWPNDPVYFPDYSNNRTREWWVTMIREFRDLLDFDALWIDMNEPANFVAGDINEGCVANTLNGPPYTPGIYGGSLADKTLCPDHRDSVSTQYNTHSLFGWFQSEPTYAGVQAAHPGKRAFVLSRSTFPGSGKYVSHWLGDNYSQWSNLHLSIIGIMAFNHYGIPFVGADICGFNGDSNAELCQRWQQLGAFYTFCRNHNGIGYRDQDPAAFGPEVAASTKKALELRYTYLPYLYTLFYFHHTQGSTVIRPLWHEFPTDPNTPSIDTQFLWGAGFMISPALEQGQTSVNVYFPDARWFSVNDGTEISPSSRGRNVSLPTPLDVIQLHVRGGYIFPRQDPALNTDLSRQNPITLLVAPNDYDEAEGYLYYDDGESLDSYESGAYFLAKYVYKNGYLEQIVENNGYPLMSEKMIRAIHILGDHSFTGAIINGEPVKMSRSVGAGILLTDLHLQANLPFRIQLQ